MWKSSVRIGNERWFPHPMPELVRYESRLRKAENHNFYKRNSTTTLFLRLNPCYDFTTKGKDLEDAKMKEVCSEIWDRFRDKDEMILEMATYEDAMKRAKIMSRKDAMQKLLETLEPRWFLEGLKVAPYQLNDDGEILGERSAQGDEEVQEDDLGDVTQCTQNEGIFGSFRDYTAWLSKVNKRLPVHLYCQLKSFFADRSKNFLEYFLSDGCFNENYEYAYSMVISDTAAFHIKQFYEL
ncbi:hypothetical protein QZH41_004972 [Actinostola sp. cb2023]|nr:hypothetical protein QZH41_004972 [Actinostola sp. cb2023]